MVKRELKKLEKSEKKAWLSHIYVVYLGIRNER
jgi:hypothetical protein